MATRRSHTKSRNGCRDCKRRKVKCDEAFPSCFNCTRHGITCSLSITRSSPGDIRPLRPCQADTQSPASGIDFLDVAAGHKQTIVAAPSIEIWGRGLELMHHYTLSTADSLAIRLDIKHLWRVTTVEIGYRCSFVMHGILTMAALHKAYLLPSERDEYLDLAASHQNAGLEGFRAALPDINDKNWETFFTFSSIVILYVASLPTRLGRDAAPNILELFTFVRGVRAVLEPYQARLHKTKFRAILHGTWVIDPNDADYRNPQMQYSPLPNDVFQALSDLATFFNDTLRGDAREEYATAVAELEKAVYLMAHSGASIEACTLLVWPYVVSENIMADIQAQSPYAMVLLAYFAVPLCVLEKRYWFVEGWAVRLLGLVGECLGEGGVLAEVVEWPRRQASELYGLI
ncbi:hypothetical protein CPLU01_05883 [Colletotrichum plurivorum]|uniref:Zn(2)-C6 fungal-type domain-containing protein n=1 Tax=Colletotrichum plurivorum TaxID=2175906 RepID=A0A8H6KK05_9PEZI|nr:hypothetical protein CPLU01_05883 [Colletotrichum plurivorum]